jgi:hypothetical protein
MKVAFGKLLQQASAVAGRLQQIGGQGQGASETRSGMQQQLGQVARQLGSALASFEGTPSPLMNSITLLREHVLPQGEALSQMLWQHWQQPEPRAAARLELAQAAATHCCAYLRCAQLGTQGGPAAGEGAGSKRCSGCHVAWYCGAACQHADWRAGHSKVCKALAAA